MTGYSVAVPSFTGEERVEFTVETERAVITFLCEWWDNLWHFSTTIDNENKRSGVLYPGIVYFPKDRTFSFKTISDKSTIGFEDLANLQLTVAISDTIDEDIISTTTPDNTPDDPDEPTLGTAAYRNVGIGAAQVPLNSHLGSAAYKNIESVYIDTTATVPVNTMLIGDTKRFWRLAAYDGDPVTITPPTGATFEGLASLELYGQYSFVELERISETVFVIKELSDYGENANGKWRRSTREQFCFDYIGPVTGVADTNNLHSWTYPMPFSVNPVAFSVIYDTPSPSTYNYPPTVRQSESSPTNMAIYWNRTTTTTAYFHVSAQGPWR